MDLKDKNVALTGHFRVTHQDDLKMRLKKVGARVRRKVDDKVEVLIYGDRAKEELLERARAAGAVLVDERTALPWVGIEDINKRLAVLRELLHGEPSAELWETLLETLDEWPRNDELKLGLDYAQEVLDARWPETLRVMPTSWIWSGWAWNWRYELARCVAPDDSSPGVLMELNQHRAWPTIDAYFNHRPSAFPIALPDGSRLFRKDSALTLRSAEGKVLASATLDAPGKWFSEHVWPCPDGEFIWFFGNEGSDDERQGVVLLLDRRDLSVRDRITIDDYLDEPNVWAEASWQVAPDGRTIVANNNSGDSSMGVSWYNHRDGRIQAHSHPQVELERVGELLGFSKCGTRLVAVDGDGCLSIWRWPDIEVIYNGFPYNLREDPEAPSLTFGGIMDEFLLIPLRGPDGWNDAWGVAALDPMTGELLGNMMAPRPTQDGNRLDFTDARTMVIDGNREARVWLFMPSRQLLERTASTRA